MKIFVSHAHEQAAVADALTLALRQEGHEVFLDRDALKAAEGFHAAIRTAIRGVDLLLFLVSPHSLESGGYALTELEIARERWPDPSARVLPVLAVPTPFERIPNYLTTVTVLVPKGDLVAEAVARVADLAAQQAERERRAAAERAAAQAAEAAERAARRRRVAGAAAGVALVASGGIWALWPRVSLPPAPTPAPLCRLDVQVVEPADTANSAGGAGGARIANVDVLGPDGERRGFVVTAGIASIEAGPLTGLGARWIIEAAPADGSRPATFEVAGCPAAPLELKRDDPHVVLRLAPRP